MRYREPDVAAETPSGGDYLSPIEFSRVSGLSLSTVRRYLASGRLPKVQPGGRRCRVLVPREALEVFQPPAESYATAQTEIREDDHSKGPSSKPSSQPRTRGPRPRWTQRARYNS